MIRRLAIRLLRRTVLDIVAEEQRRQDAEWRANPTPNPRNALVERDGKLIPAWCAHILDGLKASAVVLLLTGAAHAEPGDRCTYVVNNERYEGICAPPGAPYPIFMGPAAPGAVWGVKRSTDALTGMCFDGSGFTWPQRASGQCFTADRPDQTR